ncbi:cation:proton antiporter [Spongiactinospora rosea]|nr:cation:proton antiporter [Spongiactinospora rosea]
MKRPPEDRPPDEAGSVLRRPRAAPRLSPAVARLAVAVTVVAAGAAAAGAVPGVAQSVGSPLYMYAVTALLSIGLYSSAHGISREVTKDLRTVVLAVTVGVLLKAVLIGGVMYLSWPRPESLLLGVAVAQIDPLSVAALIGSSRMSERAKNLLLAWASFDDPITALLTVYFSAMLLGGRGGVGAYLTTTWGNALLAGVVLLGWAVARWAAARYDWPVLHDPPTRRITGVAVLLAALVVAVQQFLVLGIALIGLFLRPGIERALGRVLSAAFLVAAFALGMLLPGGVEPVRGALLGVAAYAAQVVVGGLIPARGLTGVERVYLALGQQNGITAIMLALALLPGVPDAVAMIAPAVLTVNLLHLIANTLWERLDTAGQERMAERITQVRVGAKR